MVFVKQLNEFARNLLEQERVERRELILAEVMGDMPVFPAFTTDCSPDLTEYVAAQDIPNFGVHAYYAISKQPINKWQRSELAIFPKGYLTYFFILSCCFERQDFFLILV